MRYLVTICLFIFCCHKLTAQNNNAVLDSLLRLLPTQKEDSNHVNLLNELMYQYASNDTKKSFEYVNKAMEIAQKIKWEKGIATSARYKATLYLETGSLDKALPLFQQSLAFSKKNNDISGQVIILYNLGTIFQHQSDFVNALENIFQGIKLAEEHQEKGLTAQGKYNASVIFAQQNDFVKSREYAQEALKVSKELNDLYYPGYILEIIGYSYVKEQKTKEAVNYYLQALDYFDSSNSEMGKAKIYGHLVECYPDNPAQQLHYINLADKIWERLAAENTYTMGNTGNRGIIYYQLYKHDSLYTALPDSLKPDRGTLFRQSKILLQKAIADGEKMNLRDLLVQFYKFYADILNDLKDYKGSLTYYKKFVTLHDSLFSQENKNKLAGIESRRELELKDKQLQINKLELNKKRTERIGLITGMVALVIIGTLLFYQSRNRKKNNDTLLQLNNELNEANQLKAKFFAILSHDLRSPVASLISYLQLQDEAPEEMDTATSQAYKRNIQQTAAALLNNMEALLIWSKGQMENFKPYKQQVMVSSLFHYLDSYFQNKDVTFHFVDGKDTSLYTDINYMQTIMYNLTANAVKAAAHSASPKVVWQVEIKDNKTILSISDNGKGMTAAQQQVLFSNDSYNNHKTGFGLHIIRDLAKSIDCTISVNSEAGKGTVFMLEV